jgi:hypothetical protein
MSGLRLGNSLSYQSSEFSFTKLEKEDFRLHIAAGGRLQVLSGRPLELLERVLL